MIRGDHQFRKPDCIDSGRGTPFGAVSMGTSDPKFPACKLPWIPPPPLGPPLMLECQSEKTLKISRRYWKSLLSVIGKIFESVMSPLMKYGWRILFLPTSPYWLPAPMTYAAGLNQ